MNEPIVLHIRPRWRSALWLVGYRLRQWLGRWRRCACGQRGPCWPGSKTCAYADTGYLWCKPCEEHHRPPTCPGWWRERVIVQRGFCVVFGWRLW